MRASSREFDRKFSGVLNILVSKNQARKIVTIHKYFELYRVFSAKFFKNFFSIYFGIKCLKKKLGNKYFQKNYIKSLCKKLFQIFSSIYFGTKCLKNQTKTILNYIKSSCVIFCDKMFQYFHIVYYWCITQQKLILFLFVPSSTILSKTY